MKWIGIAGTWRFAPQNVENDVREDVAAIVNNGDGIISGGALGVDYIAVDEALKHNPSGDKIKVIIPSSLESYHAHFNRKVNRGHTTQAQVKMLMEQLTDIRTRNPENLIELKNEWVHKKTFHARNTEVVKQSDELHAFQVNNSTGTQNAINTAKKLEKPTTVKSYDIQPEPILLKQAL